MSYPFAPDPYDPRRHPPTSNAGAAWRLLILALLIGGVVGWFISRSSWDRASLRVNAVPRAVTPSGGLAPEEQTTIQIFKQTNPSVVFINTTAERTDFFGDVSEVAAGSGSGFVWDKAGHIITNFHVVNNASGAQVTLWNHQSYPATVVGVSPNNDLAVLKIDAPSDQLQPILVGSSHDLQVGQKVLAIGDPFGLDQTLTTGIVSALGRSLRSPVGTQIANTIQTDAPINPGNSGGPLLDSSGRLIGVNSAIVSPSGTSAGIGFAIPVDTVNRIVPQLIAHGKVMRPKVGVQLSDNLSQLVAHSQGIGGVVIMSVQPGSPAAVAGLQGPRRERNHIYVGDIIQKVGDSAVNTSEQFYAALEDHKPGDTVVLEIYRDGNTIDVPVKLEAPEQ
jgi:S1-C subfamily serine protease